MNPLYLIPLISLITYATCTARDLHVDPSNGDDGNDGITKPLKTIRHAIRIVEPGDTIHLLPVIYHEYAGFYGKQGEPGKPITLDGHGAILEGSEPLAPSTWTEVSPGLFKNDQLLPQLNDAMIARWFFLMKGKMNLMGRTSKGKSEPLKKPQNLQAGEWTFVKDPSREKAQSKNISGTFFIKLEMGQTLSQAEIRYPARSAGVQFSGNNAHLVIRNITATHPYNDGFNIHGDCRDVIFENIQAIECGDDGISAHETAQYKVNGFVSIGNSTGICDTGSSKTSYQRVFIADCVAVDLYFLDTGHYSLSDSLILSSAQKPLIITGRGDGRCRMALDNVFIRRLGPPEEAKITTHSIVSAKRLTLDKLELNVTGQMTFDDCLINGKPRPTNAKSPGADLKELIKTIVPEIYQSHFKT